MSSLIPILAVVVILALGALILVTLTSKKGAAKAKGGAKKAKTKDRAQVLKEAARKLAANPKDVEALAAVGELAWADQEWDKAFKYYGELAEFGAGNPDVDEFTANARYGMAGVRLSRTDEAYKGLAIARTIRQDDFDVNFNLGVLEYQKKSYEKCIVLLRSATAQHSDHIASLRYLGHAQFKTKAYKEALATLKKAIDLAPDDKESLFAVAECHYELGALDQALKVFSHLRTDPALGPQASLFSGTVHLNQHQTDRAIQDFEIGLKHVETKPEVTLELKYRLAAACLASQDIGKAVGLLTEIQAVNPNYKDVAGLLGRYRELNSNRNLKTYLLGSTSEFVTMCRKITLTFLPKSRVKITDISVNKNDWADILAEVETPKWSDVVLFRYIRSSGTLGELIVRDFHGRIKDLKAGKGFCISAGGYTDEAKKFVEARLIDLIEKPALMSILNTVDTRQKGTIVE